MQFCNLILPNGKRGTLVIKGSKIIDVIEQSASPCAGEKIDCNGYQLIPGLIDPHVHFRTPGQTQKETWAHGVKAAILGGVTTIADMPNTNPTTSTIEALEEKTHLIGDQPINHRLWFGATSDNYREFKDLANDSRILGVKVYMGSSTGDLLVDNIDKQRRVFKKCVELMLTVAVHAEDEALMQRNRRNLGREPLVADHCQIRNKEVEITAVKQAILLQQQTGVLLYFCHISCPESLELIYSARQRGAQIIIEVCPHHLFLGEERLDDPEMGAYFKMNPPLRTKADTTRMCQLVCRGDFVDVIGSDHAPHTHREKQGGKYDERPSGVPGVQTILSTMFGFVARNEMSLDEFINLTSGRAGEIFFEGQKGKIEIGADADFIILDPAEQFEIANHKMKTKMRWTPFNGETGFGGLKHVVAGGRHFDLARDPNLSSLD